MYSGLVKCKVFWVSQMQSILGKSNAKYFEICQMQSILGYVKCEVFWDMSNEMFSGRVK